nr:hypothetical protein BaRGS_010159 [Batillaria attramentaria]
MKITTTGRKNGIQWTLWTQLDDLDFADDLALLSHSHSQMQDKTTCLEATSAGTGLKINRRKTELMKINTTANTPVTVGGEPIREVESFVYLGSVVDGQGGTDRDVTARIGKARAAMVMLKNIWASKVVSIRTKLCIFNSNVKSVLLYGCETWRTTKTMQQKIQTFLNTCLRRIFNIRWPEKIRNEELWERAGQEPATKQILRRKWGWIGHTLRKPASSTTRQALTWNPQGKRKRGRPRNSWRRDTEAELYKQGTNWTGVARIAQNRVRWRRVVDGLCSTWSQGPICRYIYVVPNTPNDNQGSRSTTAGRKNGIQWTLWTQLDDLDFADDLALLSHSHSQMQDKTTCLEATSAGTGLKINRKKTELMKIINMKVVVLALLCGVALGQMDFHELVGHEVHAIEQADPDLTMDMCVAKCDDLFPMADDHDEQATDEACRHVCHSCKPASCVCEGMNE